jgi:hypothetical protein
MPSIFTDEFLAAIGAEPAPFEGSLIKRIALGQGGKLAERKAELEGKMAAYPAAQREELAGRIRSFVDAESLSAQAELDVFDLLRHEFNPVEVEPTLDIVAGKTPDFWVEGHAAFEVAATFPHGSAVEVELVKALNSAPSPVKIMGLRVHNVPDDRFPKISQARNRVREAMDKYPDEPALKPFHVRTGDGMDVTGYLYRGDPAHPTVGGMFNSHGFSEEDPDYRQAVRKNVVRAKHKKYKPLADHGKPLILVFQNFNTWLDAEEFEQIFFGDVEYRYEEATGQYTLVRREVVFGPGHYRAISAALLRDAAAPGGYFLAANPYAAVPLGEFGERVVKAFSAVPLPAVDWLLRPGREGAR